MFFDISGFLFLVWSDFPDVPVKDSEVFQRWAAPMGSSMFSSVAEEDFPLCKVYTGKGYNQEDRNMKLFKNL